MKLIYIRQQNFHLADEKEQDDILTHYEKKNKKIWTKRMIISFVLVIIGVIFEIIASRVSPWMYSVRDYYRVAIIWGIAIFFVFNISSWALLDFWQDMEYRPDKTPILKLRVKSKLFVENLTIIRQKKWFVMCETDEGLIEDVIIVNNRSDFNTIKEGDMIYGKREGEVGEYVYYYIA